MYSISYKVSILKEQHDNDQNCIKIEGLQKTPLMLLESGVHVKTSSQLCTNGIYILYFCTSRLFKCYVQAFQIEMRYHDHPLTLTSTESDGWPEDSTGVADLSV